MVAARATARSWWRGRWQVDGPDLLAAAYAFHAGLPRQAATAAHVQAMQAGPGPLAPTSAAPSLARSARDGRPGRLDGAAGFPSALHRSALGEAAQQVLATGSSSQELQVLLSVADRHGQPPCSKPSWTRSTEPEQPHRLSRRVQGNAPGEGRARWLQAWGFPESCGRLVVHRCSGSVWAAEVLVPTTCGAPFRTRAGTRSAPNRRPTRARSGPTIAAERAGG